MKKYFYSDGIKKDGPFTLEELKSHKINKDTLVWFDGLIDWVKASEVDEIASAISVIPPPLPKPTSVKYDLTYEEKEDPFTFGVSLAILSISLFVIKYINIQFLIENYIPLTIISIIVKVFVCNFAVQIAKRQNRNTIGWGLFGFFLPAICLIVQSQQKKLIVK